jgi:hypothetical protein
MVETRYEQGYTATGEPPVHAVRKTVTGHVALCGAGPITKAEPGRFDTDAEAACPECCLAAR